MWPEFNAGLPAHSGIKNNRSEAKPVTHPGRIVDVFGIIGVALSSTVQACSGSVAQEGWQYSTKDSLGALVVEALPPGGSGWTKGERAELLLEMSGPTEDEVFFRVTSAALLQNGSFVVAEREDLFLFDSAGRLRAQLGGEGDGPGRFQGITSVLAQGDDGLLVLDSRLQRLSSFVDGELSEVVRLSIPAGFRPWDIYSQSGDTLVVGSGWPPDPLGADRSEGLKRLPYPVLRFRKSGELVDTVGVFPGLELLLARTPGRFRMGPSPFGSRATAFAEDGMVYVNHGGAVEIAGFGPDGLLSRVLRVLTAPRRTRTEQLDAWVAKQAEGQLADDLRSVARRAGIPEFIPEVDRITGGGNGTIWLRQFLPPGASDAHKWIVIRGTDAHFCGVVQFSAGFQVLDITSDRIIGVWRDEMEVEHIRIYGIDLTVENSRRGCVAPDLDSL